MKIIVSRVCETREPRHACGSRDGACLFKRRDRIKFPRDDGDGACHARGRFAGGAFTDTKRCEHGECWRDERSTWHRSKFESRAERSAESLVGRKREYASYTGRECFSRCCVHGDGRPEGVACEKERACGGVVRERLDEAILIGPEARRSTARVAMTRKIWEKESASVWKEGAKSRECVVA